MYFRSKFRSSTYVPQIRASNEGVLLYEFRTIDLDSDESVCVGVCG